MYKENRLWAKQAYRAARRAEIMEEQQETYERETKRTVQYQRRHAPLTR